jgi:Rrf2 family iron-sulfur cluster assembly transcriptional regulator
MIYSSACSYAIRAMTLLATVRPDGYVLMDELCSDNDLPRHFVAKIFQGLVHDGLLKSAKGRGGGFALARPASRITLYHIVAAVDGEEHFEECVVGMTRCNDRQPCPQHDEFKAVRARIVDFLKGTTLQKMSGTFERKMNLIGKRVRKPKSRSKPVR